MKNQKMKKIKEAIPLILVTMIILSTLSQGYEIKNQEFEDIEDEEGKIPPQYFIIAFGACKKYH